MEIKYKAIVWVTLHPHIHPDDARTAYFAWLNRTCRKRKKWPHIIGEKALIASARNDKKRDEVLAPVWTDRQGKVIKMRSDGFETRWKRAKKDGRAPIFDKIDDMILKNWRVMRLFPSSLGCPGLRDWSPSAASALIRGMRIGTKAGGEYWYVKKRARLGLTGKSHYRVRDFWVCKDGSIRIDVK